MSSKSARVRDIHAGEVLHERPADFRLVAEWFGTLSPARLHGVWVATIMDAVVEGDIKLRDHVATRHFSAALVMVRDRLAGKVSRPPVRFDDDSGND